MANQDSGSPTGVERRRDKRFAVHRPFLLRFGDNDKLRRWYIRDISRGGVFVRTKKPRPVGATVLVQIELPDGRSCRVTGEVVHVKEGPRGGNGVRFTETGKPALEMLEEYIRACSTPGEGALPETKSQPPALSLDLPVVGVGKPVESGALEFEVDLELPPTHSRELPGEGKGAPEAPARGHLPSYRSHEELLDLVTHLTQIECTLNAGPYEVLGLQLSASRKEVLAAHAERLLELQGDAVLEGLVPPWVEQRIERAVEAIDDASNVLTDPARRALADLELELLVSGSPDPDSVAAFEAEVGRRRDGAPDELKASYSRAEPFLSAGIAAMEADEKETARNMLLTALLYDPYNMQIRQLLAASMGWSPEG